jgi:hypothetical protein
MKSTREPTSSGGGEKKATSISENKRNSIIHPSSNSSVYYRTFGGLEGELKAKIEDNV